MNSFGVQGYWHSLAIFAAHYRQSPLQASAILVGIILAVTLLTGVRATNENAIASYASVTELLSQQASYTISPKFAQSHINESLYFDIRQQGISQSLAVIEGVLMDAKQKPWRVQGSDLIAAISALSHQVADGSHSTASAPSPFSGDIPLARLLNGAPVVLMSQSLANTYLTQPFSLAGQPLEIIAVSDDFNLGQRLLMDISLAQRLMGQKGQLSYIALFGELTYQIPQLESLIAQQALLVENDNGASMTALTDSFHLNLTAMSLLAFIVGLFIAYNGVRYSLLKRQHLLTQLQQHGILKISLIAAVISELFVLVIIGAVIGFILGLQLSYWLQPMVSVTLEQLYGANILPGKWHWSWLAQALLLTFFAALLACSSLFVDLYRQPLARNSNKLINEHSAHQSHKTMLFIALALGTIATIGMPFSDDYRVTMVLLGLVVIAIPLALPWTLMQLVSLISRLFTKGLVGYQVAETKELVPPLSLAMMAILLALTANISMNTLVGSFEITLKQWLDARLHADLYMRPPSDKVEDIARYLQQQPDADKVYKQWYLKSSYQGYPSFILTRDANSIEQTTVLKQAMEDIWQQFFDGRFVLLSEPLALKLGLNVGDKLTITALGDKPFTLAGIYFDYGNPYGELLIPPALWQQQNLPAIPTSLAVAVTGDEQALILRIQQTFELSDAQIYSQQGIKQLAVTMFKRTFSITQVLNSLTLLVAAVGLFNACFMLTQSRLAPIARLYCLGINRGQLRLMVFVQMWLIVLLTCLVALPTGALLGYLLIHKITYQAFGWTIAMVWDWQAYFQVIVLALLASTLAVMLPLYKQTRRPLVSSLQSELL
ncbi:FtsX-like permease family protein [Shewanella sp. Scap07]|uniref:FtsX-like permease family protein n=1 Tax=Shewanella sp. Scap07 TaxID=2589987 RepID=UPI0015BC0BC6|nr:FtsX-like permease family protein [Shewanella sp. Scap07]QLE84196.1 FtsX-like permease family protein [Shewanella sp. Scap07]